MEENVAKDSELGIAQQWYKKWWVWALMGATCLLAVLVAVGIYNIIEDRRVDATAITYKEDLTIGFGEDAKVSDFLVDVQGELVEDVEINTEQLGEQTVEYEYINIRNKRRKRSFTIKVIDKVAPKIYGGAQYTVPVGYQGKLTDLMMSGDDIDDNPRREILGEYDLAIEGSYNLEYRVMDANGNETRKEFMLRVETPDGGVDPPIDLPKTPIANIIAEHKTEQVKIGIDVSSWQGEIDWQAVKRSGVEFAYIRIGYQLDYDTEYIMDKCFQRNIQGALAVGLPVGVYFYSYANTVDEARKQAEWIVENIGDYQVELGIAFDWEDWADFNNAKMSFYKINQVMREFIDTVKSQGYYGLLYSSKNYLERVWEPREGELVWLAQYYNRVTYAGEYQVWQMSNNGAVPGINGAVDVDLLYMSGTTRIE